MKLHKLFLLLVTLLILTPSFALADTKPYLKVYGADVFTGGWYNSGKTACSTTSANYQAPTFTPLTNQFNGGILAFANSRHGSSTDFGAFAMGLIQGNATNTYGFYTGQTSGTNSLSFSNTNSGISTDYWGGYLAGASQQIYCIPDYFGTKQNASPAPTAKGNSFNVGTLASGQYLAPSGQRTDITAGGAATIGSGTAVTVFADGDIYISNNISYADGYTADNVPKLAIVARGNIYVGPGVTRIDGLFIAQPSTTATSTTGSFWSCFDTGSPLSGHWVRDNCGNKLTINGAVIAKQLDFLRINGDLAAAPDNEVNTSANIAETINYIPAMVIGGAFFNPPANPNPKINSLISLPPVF